MPEWQTILERPRLEPDRAWDFRDAVRPLLGDAYTLARYLLLDPVEAEEVVEEGYRVALRQFGSRGERGLKLWWLAIVRNACQARLNVPRLAVAGRPGAIGGLVRELPAQLREAVVLRDVLDLSYAQIAEVTAAPVDAVLRRLAQARTRLRQHLAMADDRMTPPPRARRPSPPAASLVLCEAHGPGCD